MSKQIEHKYDVFASYTDANQECVEGYLMVKDFPGVSQIRALLEPFMEQIRWQLPSDCKLEVHN